jgi:hypothetical protein
MEGFRTAELLIGPLKREELIAVCESQACT